MAATVTPSSAPPQPPPIPDHELIRQIGTGSYGEVWLARSVTGTYRAVKLVCRHSFDHDRPFEREFSGIQKFEPVSRTHESQIDILHVGRAPGCFYYVMELADDAERGPVIDPQTYAPKTLRTEFLRRGALPIEECVEIAMSLTTGLEHLHKHGLVHRDVKPSNIIFVKGVPKLADIGLVARADATRSFVGTEGFFPPEGPGTPQADIYSLGKVLYEVCTGLDRQEFPDLPTRIVELPNREAFLELNAIVAKACRANPEDRYQSAREMHAELLLLQTGKSVRRVRQLEGRLRRIKQIGLAAAAASAVMLGAFLFQRYQTREARVLAEANRRLADESEAQVLRMQNANGTRALEQGDAAGAALWFAENVKVAKPDSPQGRLSRLRLEWLLRESPRVEQIFTHEDGVNTASFSPDGKRVVTAGKDHKARVWDVETGAPITPLLPHDDEVWRASFSPDGRSVVSSGRDGTARIWDASTGAPLHVLRHEKGVTAAAFDSIGKRVLTASWDGTARIWDTTTGQPLTPPMTHDAEINQAQWTPDGTRVVTGSNDARAKVWNAETGELIYTMQHSYRVDAIDISRDGKRLVTGTAHTGYAKRLSQGWVWDLETGKMRAETLRQPGSLRHVRFAPDQRAFILACHPLHFHSATTGAKLPLHADHGGVHFMAFSPDGTRAVTASELNASAHVWDVQTGKSLFAPLRHGNAVVHAEFSPDGLRLLTSSDDGMTRMWNLVTGSARARTFRHPLLIWLVSLNADGSRMVTAGLDGKARVWDVGSGQLAFPPIENPHPIEHAIFSANGKRILTSPRNTGRPQTDRRPWPSLSVWDAEKGERVGPVISHFPNVMAAAISPDGQFVASASETGSIQVWEVESGQAIGAPLEQTGIVRILDFSPSGDRLIATNDTEAVTVWDWRKGQLAIPPLKHSATIRHAAFSPDGRKIATVGYEQSGRIWDAATGAPLTEPFAHRGFIHYAAWSPDGRWIATCGLSPRVRVWDGATGELALAPLEHGRDISHAVFDPSGTMLLTASHDHTARLWDLATGEQITPPLRHGAGVVQAKFIPRGDAFVTTSLDGHARVWTFPNLGYDAEDLLASTRLFSSHTSNRPGVFVAADPEAMVAALKSLREKHPERFTTSPEQVRAWHEIQVNESEDGQRWHGATWHLTELLEERRNDAFLRRRRAVAQAESAEWAGAFEDVEAILSTGENDRDLRVYAMLLAWKVGHVERCREIVRQFAEEARASNDAELKGLAAGYAALFPGLFPDYAQIVNFAEEAVELAPNNSNHLQRLAWQYYRAGRFAESWDKIKQARARSTPARNSPYVLYLQALLKVQEGDVTLARRYLTLANERLQELRQDRAESWDILLGFDILRAEVSAAVPMGAR